MKLRFNLNQIFDLIENKVLYVDQGEILIDNLTTGKNNKLPYITKKQLKIFRKMGCVQI